MTLALMAACLAGGVRPAAAHGGVAMEKDVCKLSIGPYQMHFTGYLPDKSRAEFCEDIPETGRAVIVLDILDDPVRDLPLTFKIVSQNGGPVEAAPVIFERPARTYPTGSVAVEYMFHEPGRFVGLVSLGGEHPYVSQFPFAVGENRTLWRLAYAGVAVIALALGVYVWAARRRSAAVGALSRTLG